MRNLVLTARAKGDLDRLERTISMPIIAGIRRLVLTDVGDIKKLQGVDPPEYRLRIGDWRVRFSRPDEDTICINRVQNRRDVYR